WMEEARAFVSAHTAIDPDWRGNWLLVRQTMIKECYLIETAWGDVLPQLIGAETDAAFDQLMAQFERQRLRDGLERIEQALGLGR
ncbi:MAG TPA: hypothetical protein PKE04_11060, partial [Clostridia bacterium]|nr:hypothetical protein [Clostridia bacterium]